MKKMKNALIAGATGLVGSELLKMLIDCGDYRVIHLLNRKSLSVNSAKVVEHIINFDELINFRLAEPVDHVFCTLGTTIKKAGTKENFRKVDFEYVVNLGKMAKAMNASKFLVISSLGANEKTPIFYNRVKGEMEAALKSLSLPQLFIFRPSLLIGDRKESRPGEKSAIVLYKILSPVFRGPLLKYKGVNAKKVANAMIQIALKNNESIRIFESDEIQNF